MSIRDDQPYTFVPVAYEKDTDLRVHEATFHDGGQPGRLTGEIRCTMTAKTPLLVGHYQYPASQAIGVTIPEAQKILEFSESWGELSPDRKINCEKKDGNGEEEYKVKSIIEPLFGPGDSIENRPVLINGTSIKGMLRQTIGAMTNAPMERVREQYFSYRPNQVIGREQSRYQCREAIVTQVVRGHDGVEQIKIDLLPPQKRHAIFISDDVFNHLQRKIWGRFDCGKIVEGKEINATGCSLVQYKVTKNGKTELKTKYNRLGIGKGVPLRHNDKYCIRYYRTGIDGKAEAAAIFGRNNVKRRKNADVAVIIPQGISTTSAVIQRTCINKYCRTQVQLIDEEKGHFYRNPEFNTKAISRGIVENIEQIKNGQLIYVEIDPSNNNVMSFGQHFRYRWAYADSILMIRHHDGSIIGRAETNPVIDKERVSDNDQLLSGARNLFGYVDEGGEGEDKNLDRSIGRNDFARLAGRISINCAVEQWTGKTLSQRFVRYTDSQEQNENLSLYNLQLKILSSPKASAFYVYLRPDENDKVQSYGDLPGVETSGAPLAGRKFYKRWQVKNSDIRLNIDRGNKEELMGNQNQIARFVSCPATQFRFTLRFKDLKKEELGCVLLALSPDRFKSVKETGMDSQKEYWQSIGHGRPLGMGCVDIEPTQLNLFDINSKRMADQTREYMETAVKSFLKSEFCHRNSTEIMLGIMQNLDTAPEGLTTSYGDPQLHNKARINYLEERRRS